LRLLVLGINLNDTEMIKCAWKFYKHSYHQFYFTNDQSFLLRSKFKKLNKKNQNLVFNIINVFSRNNSLTFTKLQTKFAHETGNFQLLNQNKKYPCLYDVPNDELISYISPTGTIKKGFVLCKVLDYIHTHKKIKDYKQIAQFAYELTHKNKFDTNKHSTYYFSVLGISWFYYSDCFCYYVKLNRKTNIFTLTNSGIKKMKELKARLVPTMPRCFNKTDLFFIHRHGFSL
jgi:hypothetical protein